MKFMNLFFVQIILFIVICSGLKRKDEFNANKQRPIKSEKEFSSSQNQHHDQPLTTESAGQRKRQLAKKKKLTDREEPRIKVRSVIKISEEPDVLHQRRKNKKRNQDLQDLTGTKKNKCPHKCNPSKCLHVDLADCTGFVTKDFCGCCDICKLSALTETIATSVTPAATTLEDKSNENACSKLVCPEFTECILNIQGIPVCRCPNMYACQSAPKDRVCSKEGHSYKNRCFLKIEECTRKQKIGVAYDGDCRIKKDVDALNSVSEKDGEKFFKKIDYETKKPKSKKNRSSAKNENKLKRQQNQKTADKIHAGDSLYVSQLENGPVDKKQLRRTKVKQRMNLNQSFTLS